MTIEFTVSAEISATPEAIYHAWLNSDGHTRMTGSPAHATAIVGEPFDAWDGYISGTNLDLEHGRRIVQSWRGSTYKDADGDSKIEVTFEPIENGTLVTLTHSNVPDDQSSHETGWTTHYFEPMQRYFGTSTDQRDA